MMVKIACVGKLKDDFYLAAAAEYGKRLSRFYKLTVAEVGDERIPDDATPGELRVAKEREGCRLLDRIDASEYVLALCIDGTTYDSPAFAARMQELADGGKSALTFVIGGSVGLSDAVLARANERVSLSRMTMPHRLCRVFLLEQLYRACKINAHEPYHK